MFFIHYMKKGGFQDFAWLSVDKISTGIFSTVLLMEYRQPEIRVIKNHIGVEGSQDINQGTKHEVRKGDIVKREEKEATNGNKDSLYSLQRCVYGTVVLSFLKFFLFSFSVCICQNNCRLC